MSQSSADRLISRINALHKSLQLDDVGKMSAMERDLMLGYLRELYELYASHAEARAAAPTPPPATPAVPKPAPPEPTPAPAPAPAPSYPVSPPPPPPVVTPTPVEVPPTPPPPPPVVPPKPSNPPVAAPLDAKLKTLFAEDEHASPFGPQPLQDLTRALTINNRVLFSKALFGDDNELLNTTLRTLNASGSMAAAQPVLASLARRFDWAEDDKVETAREFITLVRRRYV